MRKCSKISLTKDQILLAMIEDSLNGLIWGLGGKKASKKPKSILKMLLERDKTQKEELMSFRTPEEYEAWMARKKEQWKHG